MAKKEQTLTEKLMQEYLDNGGVITQCSTGESGLEEGSDSVWKRSAGRPKSKKKASARS